MLLDGLPENVVDAVGDAAVVGEATCERGVRRVTLAAKTGWPFRVLKTADQVDQFVVVGEIDRIEWLDRRLPVPKVMASAPIATGGHAAVFSTPPGKPATATDSSHDPVRSVELFAQALRFVHEIPIDRCPFSNKLDVRLRSIRRRLKAGRYDSMQLSEAYRRYPATQLFDMLVERQPKEEDFVFAHGAWMMDVVYLDSQGVSGITEWDRAGIADRYVDLAKGAQSVADRVGPELIPRFFECYGVPNPEPLRLDYYQLLGEFM